MRTFPPLSFHSRINRTTSRRRFAVAILLGLALLLAFPLPSLAQGIIVDLPVERPILPGPISPVTIALYSVDAVVDGPVATVHVTQIFRNDSERPVQGTYLFPLPADAAVSDFQMTVDGQILEGKILDKDEARRIYEDIVRRTMDPALLELVGQGLFQASVFPIPPGDTRKIELTYRQVLTNDGNLYRFTYPLRMPQERNSQVESLSIRVELRNQPGLRTIYSPTHDVSIEHRGDDGALIGFEATQVSADKDFDLYFGTDSSLIGANLLSYKPANEDGFFVLLAAPSVHVPAAAVVQRDILLVMDVSGSMEGEKLAQTKSAAQFIVDHLNPADRFNILAFSSGVSFWQMQPQAVNDKMRAAAGQWLEQLDAGGSTDINRTLLEALGQLSLDKEESANRPGYILFLTDGLPTQGVTEADQIVLNAMNNAPANRSVRLFTFGVGYDVNTDLLDTVSQELGGRSSYIRPEQRIDEAVSQFYVNISTPVLTDVTITFEGESGPILVEDTYPFPLPDLFAGDQLLVVGRYREGGPVTLVLTGKVNGEEQVFRFSKQQLATAGGDAFVARLWATRKIGALMTQVRRHGASQEIIDEIVDLSLTYGIVTPYTSYLVLEPDMQASASGSLPQPKEMRSEAAVSVGAAATVAVVMPASGQDAVEATQARQALQSAERIDEQEGVRYIAGKTFQQQGYVDTPAGGRLPFWVDTGYTEDLPMETIAFGSDAYFELTAQPEMAKWLSLSPEMIIVTDGKALRITTQEGVATTQVGGTDLSGLPTSGPKTDEAPSNLQERILEILSRLLKKLTSR